MSSKKVYPLVPQNGNPAETGTAIARVRAGLAQVEKAITEADTPELAIHYRDQAEALRLLARCARLGLESQNMAARLRMLAEMKAGRMLRELALRGGDRKSKVGTDRLKLYDLGVDHNESSRYQKLASLSEAVLEEYASWARAECRELTFRGLIRWTASGKSNGRPTESASLRNGQDECRETGSTKSAAKDDLVFIMNEIESHRQRLAEMLRPLYEGQGEVEFQQTQRRYIGRLIADMGELLAELRQFVVSQMQAKQ